MIAALYVDPAGVYSGLPDVDVWDEARDARLYAGPWPVVAHPPCARWSRLAGFTEARFGYKRGDDGGCFAAALDAVRRFGGVLEHPSYSKAWDRFQLPEPTWHGGWTHSLLDGGASCYVEQGRYGLPVKKATWLYAYGVELPELRWGFTSDGDGTDVGGMDAWRRQVTYREGNTTPPAFRDVLLAMARTTQKENTMSQERFDAIRRELVALIPEGEAVIFSREGYSVKQVAALERDNQTLRTALEAVRECVRKPNGVITNDWYYALPASVRQLTDAALDARQSVAA